MNYKKFTYFLISIIFLSFSFNIANAKMPENCPIKSSPNEDLNNYLKSIREIISNINSNINRKKINSLNKGTSEALSLWNSITSWDNYFTEFDFKVREPIFNNIPHPIFRDNRLLSNEIDKLNRLISSYSKKGYLDTQIDTKKICNGIKNCNISSNVGKSLIKIVESTKNIRLILQKAATNNKNIKECDNVIGITKSQCENIFKTYLNAKQECIDDGKQESIFKIGVNFKEAKNGIRKWQEAWALLTGNSNLGEYEQLEQELLKKELARQGLSGYQTEQILNNLKEYNNNGGFSLKNNPISNIVKTITRSIDKEQLSELNQFKKTLSNLFKGGKEEIPVSEISKKLKKKKKESMSNYDINTIYNQMIPLAQAEDLDTNQIVREIIFMNIYISQANNILDKTIPKSEKTCNSQDQGNGKCQY